MKTKKVLFLERLQMSEKNWVASQIRHVRKNAKKSVEDNWNSGWEGSIDTTQLSLGHFYRKVSKQSILFDKRPPNLELTHTDVSCCLLVTRVQYQKSERDQDDPKKYIAKSFVNACEFRTQKLSRRVLDFIYCDASDESLLEVRIDLDYNVIRMY